MSAGGAESADVSERILRAWRDLRRGTSSLTIRQYLNDEEGASLDQGQLDALEILATEPGGWRMSEFADALRVDPSTATRAIDRLVRLGLAARTTSADDRRIVIARPTTKGLTLLRRSLQVRAAGVDFLLDGFATDDREALATLLERVVASLDRAIEGLNGRD
jgi:DNA-binding MarR family transcriptional regulator